MAADCPKHNRPDDGAGCDHTQPGDMILVSAVVAPLVLIGGLYYFRQMEKTFADVV